MQHACDDAFAGATFTRDQDRTVGYCNARYKPLHFNHGG